MDQLFYDKLSEKSLNGDLLGQDECESILSSDQIELLPLLNAAYKVRKKYCGNEVTVHILNNVQNGFCPEDCSYCAQSKDSDAKIESFPQKDTDQVMSEAKRAYEMGAHRYCMVFAGRGPNEKKVNQIADLIKKIKAKYPLSICVSAGLIDENGAKTLKAAGLDRLNHNLNTSEDFYPEICSSHTFRDRLNTLKVSKKAGLELCSGIIIGMGESIEDICHVAYTLRENDVKSIPVNFLIPIEGNKVKSPQRLTPQYCLRVLTLFRLLNPKSEIRAAAGREGHLRDLEVMALYPANSLFLDGYLNTKGSKAVKTLRMIKDAGFIIKSDHSIEDLLKEVDAEKFSVGEDASIMKTLAELKPN